MQPIIIIGGGASGLAAGVSILMRAQETGGARVILLERQERVGKKILATGNGRCNLTNADITPRAARRTYCSENIAAVETVLTQAPPARILAFFARLGLICDTQDEGRVYPHSNQAAAVLTVLRGAFARLGGTELCGFCATEVRKGQAGRGFTVTSADGRQMQAARVIVCTGGLAAPQFGCDETGYRLLGALGHTLVPPYPCLVPMKSDNPLPRALKGVKLRCTARLYGGKGAQQTLLGEQAGEVLCTEYGFSGIPVMQLSHFLSGGLCARGAVLALDLLPAYTPEETLGYVHARRAALCDAPLTELLCGAVHTKAGPLLLKSAGLSSLTRLCGTLTDNECLALARLLQQWTFTVTGTLAWNMAQVTGGGVPLDEVDAQTMESTRCRGLYLCGEALDAVGTCGGYNLHWAWATGILAGENCMR